jgi:hypothetical protein
VFVAQLGRRPIQPPFANVPLDWFGHQPGDWQTAGYARPNFGCGELTEDRRKIQVQDSPADLSRLTLEEVAYCIKTGTGAGSHDQTAAREKIFKRVAPVAEPSMIALSIPVVEIKHALECIEANDKVQIRSRREYAFQRVDHVYVKRVRRKAYRDSWFISKRQMKHREAVFKRAVIPDLVGVGQTRQRDGFIKRKGPGCAAHQLYVSCRHGIERRSENAKSPPGASGWREQFDARFARGFDPPNDFVQS